MSCGYTDGKRVPNEFGVGVTFDGWDGLNEHEQLAAKASRKALKIRWLLSRPRCL